MVKICSKKCLAIHQSHHKKAGYWASVNRLMNDGYTKEEAIEIRNSKANSQFKISYWVNLGYSEYEAISIISENQKINSPRCKEYWINKGYTDEDALKKVSTLQKEFASKKNPEISKVSSPWSVNYYIHRGHTLEEAKELVKNNGQFGAHNLENYVIHYGSVDGPIKFENYMNGLRERGTVKYYTDLYGDDLGVKKYLERFGRFVNSRSSKIANDFCDSIYAALDKNIYTRIMYSDIDEGEYLLLDHTENLTCFYDFVIMDIKFAIEFNGDFWHGNPNIYGPDDVINGKKAKDIWEYDSRKKEAIEKRGFTCIYVWENEYRQDKEGTLKRVMETIQEITHEKLKNN
jgi:hypothetical protein